MKELRITGIMSGTSLDGVDLALCSFTETIKGFDYSIIKAETVPYNSEWKSRLRALENASAELLAFEHAAFGELLGSLAYSFNKGEKVDFISSHGHTIFHQPSKRFTFQLGSGAAIAAVAGIPVVCDFRSKDVTLGGQGAPLVPIGDELLFGDYDYCLNLGGIANISMRDHNKRVAHDICPVNLILNELAKEAGLEYDSDGQLASQGSIINGLLDELNHLSFYSLPGPKSLGREMIVDVFLPLLERYRAYTLIDRLSTCNEHIAQMIGHATMKKSGKMFVTGGGAYNGDLVARIRKYTNAAVIIPERKIIEFKEALIFAFLGWLRWEGKVNALSSVTGAKADSCGGCIYK